MCKISVIIPVFNCEPYVADCLRSVTDQTERDLEIIVVDDGSTDGSLNAVRQIAASDPRISVCAQPHSGYPGVSRNVGLSHATARYVTLLDGDDLYHPDKVRRSLALFEHLDDVEIVFHDYKPFQRRLDEPGTALHNTSFTQRATPWLSFAGDKTYVCRKDFYKFASLEFVPCHISSTTFRRDLLSPSGPWFRENLRNGDDGDFWLRLLRNRKVAFLNEVLSYYRVRSPSISSDVIKHLVGAVELHTDNLTRGMDVFSAEEAQRYRSKIAALLCDLGYQYFLKYDNQDARSAYKRSMKMVFRAETLEAYLKTFAPKPVVGAYRKEFLHIETDDGRDDHRLPLARQNGRG
jgi:glycosyltransferase involved in cell wall biosynthesis